MPTHDLVSDSLLALGRTKSNAALLAAIRQVHQDSSGRYGSPGVHAVLRRQGRGVSRGRIERMMRRSGIRAIMAPPRRVRTTDSRHDLPIAPNLIARDFTAQARGLARRYHLHPWLYLAAVTRAEAERDIFAFIEGFYNRTRLHSAIGYIARSEMELKAA